MPTLSQADLDHIDLALEFHQSNYDNAMTYPARFMFIAFPIISPTTPKPLTPPPSTPTLDLDDLVRQLKAQWYREQELKREQGLKRAQELERAKKLQDETNPVFYDQESNYSDSSFMSSSDPNYTGKYISISDAYPSPETQMMQAQEAEMQAQEAEMQAHEAEIQAAAAVALSSKSISLDPDTSTSSTFARHLRKFHSTKKELRIQTRNISPPFDLRSGGPEIVREDEIKPERLRRIWAHVCPARLHLF